MTCRDGCNGAAKVFAELAPFQQATNGNSAPEPNNAWWRCS